MRLLAPVLLLAVLLCAAVVWDRPEPRADVVFVNRGEVFTLDPQRMSYLQDFRLAWALYEGLVRWNNHDLSIQPAAALLPEISSDRLTYTFHLRPAAKWSNGDPVTAHDFVYSFHRLLWPDTVADYSNFLFDIAGARDFFAWRTNQLADYATRFESLEADDRAAESQRLYEQAVQRARETIAVRALDDLTLRITLTRPVPYFLDLLCFAVCCPVHRPTVEGWPAESAASTPAGWHSWPVPALSSCEFLSLDPDTAQLRQRHEWARPGSLIGNGPYVLTQWRYKRDIRLDRNPLYHDQSLLRNNSVQGLTIEDANTSLLAYTTGQVDWLNDVSVDYLPDLVNASVAGQDSANAAAAAHALPTFGVEFYSFNCRPTLPDGRFNPFSLPAVRRAFVQATDSHSIVQRVTRLLEPVMTALIPPGSIPGYESPEGLGFNLDQARYELGDAGWTNRNNDGLLENAAGEPFPVIDLLYVSNSAQSKWISLDLKAQWESALGVRVEPRAVETKFYKNDLRSGKFMIARGRWYGDYADPTTFLNINLSTDGNNDRAYSNPTFDQMLTDADREPDPAIRLKRLSESERWLFTNEPPLIPMRQIVQVSMYDQGRVMGLTTHPRLIQYLWQIEVTKP